MVIVNHFSLLCVVTSCCVIISFHHGVVAKADWSVQYTLDNGRQDSFTPELRLLPDDSPLRHRRYVPDSVPLDEYTNLRDSSLYTSKENLPPMSRHTKEIKFSDGKPASLPHAGLTDNTAAREVTPLSTSIPTITTPSSPLNKSVIISAEFDAGTLPSSTTNPDSDDDDLAMIKNSDEVINSTMTQNNITNKTEDTHLYYNSTFIVDYHTSQSYWVDMTKRDDVKVNSMLSRSHRRAVTVKLSFDFPFYGHLVRNVMIATGGFLYTGEYGHSWLAATQYIAPLMANFDTSLNNESYIKYVDNGTAFTVMWEKVSLQDKPTLGEFTFQVTLHASGDIVFVYQNVPVIIENIQDDQHPVKVGLSDAYIIDRTIFFVRRKTIYEYHRVNFNKEDIKNWTVIYLNALPTCMEKRDCNSCVTVDIGFECKWCAGAGRCSTGMDRQRQDWLANDCDHSQVSAAEHCAAAEAVAVHERPRASAAAAVHPVYTGGPVPQPQGGEEGHDDVHVGGSSFLGAAFVIVLVAALTCWTWYAYHNPHTMSGQILIRYRPSQWSWRRGEARYTAATIHM